MTILVCGEALYDLFVVGETADGALRVEARIGGSPLNVAIGLARLGAPSALLAGVSRDMLGARLAAHLRSEGVDDRFLRRTDRLSTISLVGLSESGEPAYAFYGEGAADRAISPDDLPAIPEEVDIIHLGSYALVVEPMADALAALVDRAAGRFLSLDPNVRPTVEPRLDRWRTRIDALRRRADLVKVSREDLAHLHPGADAVEIAAAWSEEGPDLVVLTDGARGAIGFRGGQAIPVPAAPVAVVDTVGAGDAFQAALLAQIWSRGLRRGGVRDADPAQIEAMLAYAATAAGLTCARRGADPPHAQDLPPLDR